MWNHYPRRFLASSAKRRSIRASSSCALCTDRVQQQLPSKRGSQNFSDGVHRQPVNVGQQPGQQRHWFSSVSMTRNETDKNDKGNHQGNNDIKERHEFTPNTQFDFFGEPLTFLSRKDDAKTRKNQAIIITHAMAALDGHLLAVISKGRSCVGGGAEGGLTVKANHAAALSWAELLRFAAVWQERAPLLTVVAVAPVLAHAGVAYVQEALDPLLARARPSSASTPGLPKLQCLALAKQALHNWEALEKEHQDGNKKTSSSSSLWHDRERFHMRALSYLLRDEHNHALVVLLKCLQQCPGDALALSLAMDLSQTTGQKWAAGKAATTVSAYWYERRGGIIRPSLPGHAVVSSLIALGLAVDGRAFEAEAIADQSMSGKKITGAIATWALGHIYDATGRTSEGISALANSDGMVNYEGAGWLLTTDRWATYGARYALDREERGGRFQSPALRLYETHVSRVLETSGYSMPNYSPEMATTQAAPMGWLDRTKSQTVLLEAIQRKKEPSWYDKMFGKSEQDGKESTDKDEEEETTFEMVANKDQAPSRHRSDIWTLSAEDVLTFLPPTPIFLCDATLLLFRMTLNGTLSRKNERWDQLRNAWQVTVDQHHKAGRTLAFCPLAAVAASMVLPPSETGAEDLPSTRALAHGLHRMGHLLQFGKNLASDEEKAASSSSVVVRENLGQQEPDFWLPVADDQSKAWQEVVKTLRIALDGFDEEMDLMDPSRLRFTSAWDMDGRPVLEHAVVYSACKAGDIESLSLARSICSRGVSLRPNSPDEWWRYSIVLGLLGDQVASEDALNTSINVGGGQGSR